jgi:hypothetical protein
MLNQKRIMVLVVGILLIGLAVFAVGAKSWRRSTKQSEQQAAGRKSSPKEAVAYLRRSILKPRLQWGLRDFGDRFEKPGNERVSIAGVVQAASDSAPLAVTVINEFPERARLVFENENRRQTIVFNHGEVKNAAPLTDVQQSLLETFANDSVEHFFWTQMQGQATRSMGDKFRLDDGSSANYDGPYYDVYQLMDESNLNSEGQPSPKFFYFNAATLLLERVVYQRFRDNDSKHVEVVFGDWRKQNGQSAPFRIERIENGQPVFVFSVKSLGFGPRGNEDTFNSVTGN